MSIIKALLVGLGCAIAAFVLVVALELVAMAMGVGGPFADVAKTGSGGLGAWSAGFSELAFILAVIAGVMGAAWSYRRQRRLRRLRR